MTSPRATLTAFTDAAADAVARVMAEVRRDAETQQALSRNVRLMLKYNLRIRIVGHADDCDD